MVPDPLNRRLSGVLKMIGRHPGALLSALAAGALTLVLVTWLGGEQGERSHAGDRPSLLELLDQVSKERGRQLEDAPLDTAPQAPRARSWTSPLARQCSGIDPAVKQRLETLMSQEASWRSDLAIDATNFGRRHERDAFGRRLDITPRVVVIHETVYSMTSAVNTFLTPHPRDEDQVSYHTLIGRDGRVLDLVDPSLRAYGAGYSAFLGEWAITNKRFKGSVNNFALHVSLETPSEGANSNPRHSGYRSSQYDALALVLSGWIRDFNLPPAAITTHRHVDVGGERSDPRSFDWAALQSRLASLGDLCVARALTP
jgi:N-acetylmuramoyl-L-alanine amidase